MKPEHFSAPDDSIDETSRLILEYIRQHPEAGDTLEGIARWWVLRQQLDETLQRTRGALGELKSQGLVVECRTPDCPPFYFLRRADMIAAIEVAKPNGKALPVSLDHRRQSAAARRFEERLSTRIVGQESAVRHLSDMYEVFLAGLAPAHRPVGTLLFLGPTGCGKTRVVEETAEILFGNPRAFIRVDCAEFQHSHEIAKLIGAPPGYAGHAESSPILSQENLDRFQTADTTLSLVLFDEIEKASEALWQLLLGILDQATLTLGDNRRVDFSRSLIVMTSNLGAREMAEMVTAGIGFNAAAGQTKPEGGSLEAKLRRTAVEAARRSFSPEFMNRVDATIVFRSLDEHDLRRILDLELQAVQERIMRSVGTRFVFHCTDAAKALLLREGLDYRYGARHLKRSVARLLVAPLSKLVATHQIESGSVVYVDADPEAGELLFSKYDGHALIAAWPETHLRTAEAASAAAERAPAAARLCEPAAAPAARSSTISK